MKSYQQVAPGKAMDRAEVVSLNEDLETPAGAFTDLLRTQETTPINHKEKEYKTYAPDMGLIQDEHLLPKSYGFITRRGPASLSHRMRAGAQPRIHELRRSVNEDAYCALVGSKAPIGTEALLAIADGMAGRQGGEVASSIAIHGLVDDLFRVARSDGIGARQIGIEQMMASVFEELDRDIRGNVQKPGRLGMGTTPTAALAVDGSLLVAHVGDTRACLLRNGELFQLTRDHTWVEEQVARGVLTPAAAKSHSKRNVILEWRTAECSAD